MNPEAISAIKKASTACLKQKEAISSYSYQRLSENKATLSNKETILDFKLNADTTYKAIDNITFNQSDLINISIRNQEGSWYALSRLSLYYGKDSTVTKLIETSRTALKETCSLICPGLSNNEIMDVIELFEEDFKLNKELTQIENIFNHKKLMAGDIIYVQCSFKSTMLELNSTHAETILITGNGAEILTT